MSRTGKFARKVAEKIAPAFNKPRLARIAGALLLIFLSFGAAHPALAETLQVDLSDNLGLTDQVVQIVALVTILSLAPSILIMVTSFVRIIVVLSLLRTALGMQQSPPNAVLVSLALFLTAFVMTPTFTTAYHDGIEPLMNQQMETAEAFDKSRPSCWRRSASRICGSSSICRTRPSPKRNPISAFRFWCPLS